MHQPLFAPHFARIIPACCIVAFWLPQVRPLHAQAFPIDWTLDAFETSTSEWWQALDVRTVPGVLYRLQESSTLNPDEWTTFSSSYGTGGNWICPVFPGIAPITLPPGGNPVLPPATSTPVRTAYLTIERTDTGSTLVSWNSLDDNTPLRKLLSNVTLDPVWDNFESFYLNHHGSHFFALSPRLGTPVAFSETSITLGPLDSAMLADFTTEFPAITSNIQNSVAAAASFSPQPMQSGERAFFRIAADWSVDSDSDGRFDWQEIMFDGNNPFVTDSDGDGVSDADEVAQGTNPTNPSSYTLAWRRIERNLTYDFTYGTDPQPNSGTLALNATWNAALDQSEALTSPIAFTSLEGRLAGIPFNNSVPAGAFSGLIPAEGNATIPIAALNTRIATLKHQRVWLTRSPAKDYPFEKKAIVFTDRSLNGSEQNPAFEIKTFTLPANQTVSNPVDLESGFTSDGPAGGPTPPPAAIPAGHAESFTKQLVPVQVDDNEFATGVDNVSVTAAISDIGYQEKFWIMAPAGNDPAGVPCANAMKFNIPLVPSVEMEIVPPTAPNPTATPDPATLTLGASSPCIWRGVGADTTELAIVWKLGLAGPPSGSKQDVDLPVGVKLMKRRTVKIDVHYVTGKTTLSSGDIELRPPTAQPDVSQIADKLYNVFSKQINTWFDLECISHVVAWDIGLDANWGTSQSPVTGTVITPFNRELNLGGAEGIPSPISVEEQALLNIRKTDTDIDVFVIGGCWDIQTYLGINGVAIRLSSENRAGVTKRERRVVYLAGELLLASNPLPEDLLLHSMAHEIGHVFIGNGHPDDETSNGSHAGPAPLKGTNRLERLMYSDEAVKKNAGTLDRNLLVKTEWDKAEDWLKLRLNGDN